ncbi:hypothetical protein B296_00009526 [Ensete ventricosum]|uniref:Pentacotripeptide-repeat region of PRORP domain-containing protein n=1 Tax=Ensete ventricosum TaxID=4639 RepID=A0A427A474_ENSVE|nr:hypothetical protein B296_00009526 [Ensete ventricosum]
MECLVAASSHVRPTTLDIHGHKLRLSHGLIPFRLLVQFRLSASPSRRKLHGTLRYPRRAKLPPDPGTSRLPSDTVDDGAQPLDDVRDGDVKHTAELSVDDAEWSPEELEAISALFERPMPQKASKPVKDRPLPLPSPYEIRPSRVPTPKRHVRSASRSVLAPRSAFVDRVHKNPEALIGIAREIAALPADSDACEVLDRWTRFLRKGSLSMTIRELGHMGLPKRALQTLCWAQKQPSLFPDDRTLASTVELLARCGQLRMESEMGKYLNFASRTVIEAMARGFLRAGRLHRARKILLFAKDNKRTLDPSIYAKLIAEAGKTPDGYRLASAVLDELGERDDFHLEPQDCTAIMKVCIKLGRFEAVENLFSWYKQSGRNPTVVMYTTVIHSRYCEKKHREALALVWEMESSGCLLDLPAYRVIIRLLVVMNDLARAARYFSKLKDAGFSPTYDIYRDMIKVYAASRRLAKCRQVRKEAEMAGLRLDERILSLLSEMESDASA